MLLTFVIFIGSLTAGAVVKGEDKEISNQGMSTISSDVSTTVTNTKDMNNRLIVQKTEEDKKRVDVAAMADLHKFKSLYGVFVSLDKQKVYIFKNNQLIKTLICSTGIEGSDTPKGTYTIEDRAPFFFSQKFQEGGLYWVRFMGDYLFHSVPTDANGNVIPQEATKLGVKASHGCIRLSVEDARWFYENVSSGAELIIS